jgi:hypothetical protein
MIYRGNRIWDHQPAKVRDTIGLMPKQQSLIAALAIAPVAGAQTADQRQGWNRIFRRPEPELQPRAQPTAVICRGRS